MKFKKLNRIGQGITEYLIVVTAVLAILIAFTGPTRDALVGTVGKGLRYMDDVNLTGTGTPPPPPAICGKNGCEPPNETCRTCQYDCGICCGNGACDIGETVIGSTAYCPGDCDCDDDETCDPEEDRFNCPNDCECDGDGTCNWPKENNSVCAFDCSCNDNGACDPSKERIENCPAECTCDGDGTCDTPTEVIEYCAADCQCNNDTICNFPNENDANCPGDCECTLDGTCNTSRENETFCADCGCNSNNVCEEARAETDVNCSNDCVCLPDNSCQIYENSLFCPDCGCNNDGDCDANRRETITSCPNDCECNNDLNCDPKENIQVCPNDCGCDRDGVCETSRGESITNCSNDCACGGLPSCEPPRENETVCPSQCGCDRDGICEPARGETIANCGAPAGYDDCSCNQNGVCECPKENNVVCPSGPPQFGDCVCNCNGACDGDETYATCPQECPAACRNGTKEDTEECDDGNPDPCDGCSYSCRLEECGNDRRDGSGTCQEECDTDTPISCTSGVFLGRGFDGGTAPCIDAGQPNECTWNTTGCYDCQDSVQACVSGVGKKNCSSCRNVCDTDGNGVFNDPCCPCAAPTRRWTGDGINPVCSYVETTENCRLSDGECVPTNNTLCSEDCSGGGRINPHCLPSPDGSSATCRFGLAGLPGTRTEAAYCCGDGTCNNAGVTFLENTDNCPRDCPCFVTNSCNGTPVRRWRSNGACEYIETYETCNLVTGACDDQVTVLCTDDCDGGFCRTSCPDRLGNQNPGIWCYNGPQPTVFPCFSPSCVP